MEAVPSRSDGGSVIGSALSVRDGVDVGTHHANFVVFLVQVMQQNVPQRDDANQLSFMANGQML